MFVTGWITRKYIRPVIENMIVLVMIGVRPPPPHPQHMRIWRWLNKTKALMTVRKKIVRSVVGVDGLREFVMLPKWTVN